jgi:galactitol-specific phosphotransferase system IIB component
MLNFETEIDQENVQETVEKRTQNVELFWNSNSTAHSLSNQPTHLREINIIIFSI